MNNIAVNIIDPWSWNRYEFISIGGVLALLSIVIFFLIINRVINKKRLKAPLDNDLNLEEYTLGFDTIQIATKEAPLSIKILACFVSVFLVLIPLNDLLYGSNLYETIWAYILW